MQRSTLWNKDVLCEGYRPKMLLYALDELFYIYDQVKHHWGVNEKLVVVYEVLSCATLCCMECQGGVEKQGMPDAVLQINLSDNHHLEHLVGSQPKLPGNCQWCTVLSGTFKHSYRGHNDAANCPPYTLALWDCLQRTEVLCEEQRWDAAQSGHNAPRARRRRSRSSFRCCSRTLSHRGWSGYSCCSPPNMLPRCHCGKPLSPSSNTTPKLSSALSVPAYARSSHSAGADGMGLPG